MQLNLRKVEILDLIKQPIREELARYEEEFRSALLEKDATLSDIFLSLSKGRGKQMRPILVLLTAKGLGNPNKVSALSAATVELLHTASLVHDDVVDESDFRRGNASIRHLFGNKLAVLAGDFLLSSALSKSCETQDIRIISRISRLGNELASGEIKQLRLNLQKKIDETEYFEIIGLKTSALFATCCELGARSVGASEGIVEEMSKMGGFIGDSFQIKDDIFDYFEDANIGKPTGNDMAEGKITLPLILASKMQPSAEIDSLIQKVIHQTVSKDEIHTLVEFTKQAGGIDAAYQIMEQRVNDAKQIALQLPQPAVREALLAYIDYVGKRSK